MFDIASLFISVAHAAEETAAAPAALPVSSADGWIRFAPLFLIFIVFYFLLIRPQQKELEKQRATLKALKKGDKILTSGGIIGTIVKMEGETYLIVEIAKGVEVKLLRHTINGLAGDIKEVAAAKTEK